MNKFLDILRADWERAHTLTNDQFQMLLKLARANDTALIRESMVNLSESMSNLIEIVKETLDKLKGE